MKKNLNLSAAMAAVTLLLLVAAPYSCQKKPVDPGSSKTASPKVLTVNRVNTSAATEDVCAGHGGVVEAGVSWAIATRRSDCERGIGFRCGHFFYAKCMDGVIIKWHPLDEDIPDNPRKFHGTILFFDTHLEITFDQLVPETEIGNTQFEMEGDVTENFPDYLQIDGKHYSQMILKEGVYRIDYAASPYGTVSIDYQLIP